MAEKKEDKKSYNKYLLVFGCAAIAMMFFIVDGFEINDGSMCKEGEYAVTINNKWVCDKSHYAEGFYHSYTNPVYINLITTDVYYNITNYTLSFNYGFGNQDHALVVNKNSMYNINLQIAMQGGLGGDYEIELHKNNITVPECASFITTSGADYHNLVINCLQNLSINDVLDVRIKDISNPPKDVYYHQLNFNIKEVK